MCSDRQTHDPRSAGLRDAIVVCPLRYEQRALRRHRRGRAAAAPSCCGPGAAAMAAWARMIEPAGRAVILAGLAGALRRTSALGAPLPAGTAFVAAEVRSEAGDVWRPPLTAEAAAACTIVSSPRAVCSAGERRSLAERSGADLVDLESAAFAAAASVRGWTWGIVRGISDDADADLPEGVERWIDDRVRSRVVRVAFDLLRAPCSVIVVARLRRDSSSALRSVAMRIAQLGDEATR